VTILVVRHALAGEREAWDGDDRERPLSAEGERQAAALPGLLAGRPVRRVISSPARRCTDTVAPLARALGLDLEVSEMLWETTPAELARPWLLGLARRDGDGDVVVCSHGDLIGPLVSAAQRGLTGEGDGVDDVTWDKGSTWLLEPSDATLVATGYLPPPGP
jgi:broad specificity phosphatase PhoE